MNSARPHFSLSLHRLPGTIAGAATVAAGAWIAFPIPGTDIPQTGQTIAVLVCGALLGSGSGVVALLFYLLAGVLGLPVFSDGAAGWATLLGSSAGYFAGFVLAAALTGLLLDRQGHQPAWRVLCVMLLGHLLILAAGWVRLAMALGPDQAFAQGVLPFLYGAAVKSVLATGLIMVFHSLRTHLQPHWPGPTERD